MQLTSSDYIWVLGAGRFGTIAAQRLLKKVARLHVRAVDHRQDRLRGLPPGTETISGDAVSYLVEHIGVGVDPDWIVPAVPVHVAWEFIRKRLSAEKTLVALTLGEDLLSKLPNAMTGEGGAVYASIADFLCPDNCPEPADRCTHTGKPRPMELFSAIPDIADDAWSAVVVRSHQLAPGVGGYRPAALLDALDRVETAQKPVLLATACRCHGVIHGIGKASDS